MDPLTIALLIITGGILLAWGPRVLFVGILIPTALFIGLLALLLVIGGRSHSSCARCAIGPAADA
jgi:hypothetical protein